MKKLFFLIALFAFSASIVRAQVTQKTPEERAARFTKVLTKKLNLSAGQAQQVNAIYLTQATRMDSLKANPSQNKQMNRLTARSITLSTRQHMMAVLNDTQKQEYTQWVESQKKRQRAKKDTVGAGQQ